MPRVKSLLKKAIPETAKRPRTCRNSGLDIPKGSQCLVVFDGPRTRFCYSLDIGRLMIVEARKELDTIEKALNGSA